LESTALRETYEEIGIPPSQIDILGKDSTVPNKDRTIKVYPFIGFIKRPIDVNKINFNEDEVCGVFSITLNDLLNQNKRWEVFRDPKIKYPVCIQFKRKRREKLFFFRIKKGKMNYIY
jgi:nudix motif 8